MQSAGPKVAGPKNDAGGSPPAKEKPAMSNRVRRVVTGHDAAGKAVVSMDGEPPVVFSRPEVPGLAFYEVWNTASSPAVVDSGADPTEGRPVKVPPPANGTIIRVIDFPPENPAAPKPTMEQAGQLFGLMGLHPPADPATFARHPFMHRTSSIDYGIVLSGSITMVLDETEVELKAGDVVVQRGTNHAWANRSGTVCRMAFILVDGAYAPELAQRFGK
jgi:mannose-6-phosphate isomerase-like protein (cupin superfamily)